MRVIGEIPQRAVATWIEGGIMVAGRNARQHPGVRQLGLRVTVALKANSRCGLRLWPFASRIDRGKAPLRRCKCESDAGVLEDVVGRSEPIEPEAGLLASVPKSVVRGQSDQYPHLGFAPLLSAWVAPEHRA